MESYIACKICMPTQILTYVSKVNLSLSYNFEQASRSDGMNVSSKSSSINEFGYSQYIANGRRERWLWTSRIRLCLSV